MLKDRIRPDPLALFARARCRANTSWLRATYPFAAMGRNASIHFTCDLDRAFAPDIAIGNHVYIAEGVWINSIPDRGSVRPKIVFGDGCRIGRRSTISCKNKIELEADVLLAPGVLIMDHNHAYSDTSRPIHAQGVTGGGRIIVEKNCWLGYAATIICGHGELVIGRNSVVGAHSVITRSMPPYSVIAGNPAKVVKQFDKDQHLWVRVHE